jgi:hypothetical protein
MKFAAPLVLAFASQLVACGSSHVGSGASSSTESPDAAGAGGSSAGGASGTGGGSSSSGTACGTVSGYKGDDLCIPPPAAGEGIQLHAGPTSYDDPDAVAPYLLAPGAETVDCFNAVIPESDFYYLKQENRMRPSSHHMLISAHDDPTLKEGPSTACDNFGAAVATIPGSQTPKHDFPDQLGPEDSGIGRRLPKANIAAFQMHYINTTSEPVLREAWVNLYKKDPSEVTTPLQSIFMVGDLAVNVPAHTEQTTTLEFTPKLTEETRIFEANAHMHAHAQAFSLWRVRAGKEELLYQSFNWEDPLENTFNSVVKNPPLDSAAKTDGGLSGVLTLLPGDTLRWSCDVNNTTNAALHFANEALTAEMCMLVGAYISNTSGLMSGACFSGKCGSGFGLTGG